MDHKTSGDGEGGAFFGIVYSGENRPRPIVGRPAAWLADQLHRVAGRLYDWAQRPAEGVPLTAEQLEVHTIDVRGPALDERLPWPVTVYSDRYGGTYSGGDWLAAIGWAPLFDSPPFDSDVPCFEWWEDGGGARIGRGPTPDAALADLHDRWEVAGRPREFDWDGVQEGETGPPVDAEHAAEVRQRDWRRASAILREYLAGDGPELAPDPVSWLDWPDEGKDIRFQWRPGHVVIFEGGADAAILAERVNRPAPPERCVAWMFGNRCVLPTGHPGHHETAGGMMWKGWPVTAPGQCPNVAPSLLNGLPTGPQCELEAGHDGPHRAGESDWREL